MLLLVLLLWLGSKGLLDLVAWHRPPRRKIPKDKKQKTDLYKHMYNFCFQVWHLQSEALSKLFINHDTSLETRPVQSQVRSALNVYIIFIRKEKLWFRNIQKTKSICESVAEEFSFECSYYRIFPQTQKLELHTKQIVPCESTAQEVSFECSHHRILSTDSKVRTTCVVKKQNNNTM